MKGRDSSFKCIYCGKYVSYSDIEKNKVEVKFTPDTHFTVEKFEMYHKSHRNYRIM